MSTNHVNSKRRRSMPVILLSLAILIGAAIAATIYWNPEARAARDLDRAERAFDQGDAQNAIRYYEASLEASPEQVDVQIKLAKLYLSLDQTDAAKRMLDRIAMVDPMRPEYLEALMSYALAKDDYPLAYSLKDRLRSYSLDEATDLKLIQGLLDANLLNDAFEALTDAQKDYPSSQAIKPLWMDYYELREDFGQMEALYRENPELFDENLARLTRFADYYMGDEDWEMARIAYDAALELEPQRAKFLQDRYIVAMHLRELQRADQLTKRLGELRIARPTDVPRIIGTTAGNLANGGFVVYDDQRYYYVHHSDGSLQVTDASLVSREQLLEDRVAYLNVSQGWLYYQNLSRDGCVYKLPVDGGAQQKLTQMSADQIAVWGPFIYFRSTDDDHKLYRSYLDGSERTALSEEAVKSWTTDGRSLYYTTTDGLFELKDVMLDPSVDSVVKPERILRGSISHPVADGEALYYIKARDEGSSGPIFAMDLRGKQSRILLPGLKATDINLDKDYLYYTDQTVHRIHRVSLVWEKLGVTLTQSTQVTPDWIFARSPDNDLPLARFKMDGSLWGLLDDTLR